MKKIITIILLISCNLILGQRSDNYFSSFFKLVNYSGELNLNGDYSGNHYIGENYSYSLANINYSAGGKLKTKSFIYHPNFLIIDVDLIYNPSFNKKSRVGFSEINGKNINNQFDVNLQWFRKKNILFSNYFNLGRYISNYDFIGSSATKYIQFGGVLNLNYKLFPLKVTYNKRLSNFNQNEFPEHEYKNGSELFNALLFKSITKYDNSSFSYSYQEYLYEPVNAISQLSKYNEISMTTNIFSKKSSSNRLSSRVSFNNRNTPLFEKNDFYIRENLKYEVLKNLNFFGNFNYTKSKVNDLEININNYTGSLIHQLYSSLTSTFSYNNLVSNYSDFDLNQREFHVDFSYKKKIPFNGLLTLKYNYTNIKEDKNVVNNNYTTIYNDRYQLIDGDITFLSQTGIDINSIVVKSGDASIIYQLNFDYMLIAQGDFIQIRRSPGGQIANNSNVLVDFGISFNDSFKVDSEYKSFSANISIFKFLTLYYANSLQDYSSDGGGLNTSFDRLKNTIVGGYINYRSFNFETVYDVKKSDFIPYRLLKFKFRGLGRINNKINYSLDGIYNKYFMIFEEGQEQTMAQMNLSLRYNLTYNSRISFDINYSNQEGLNLLTKTLIKRLKYSANINKLYIELSLETLNRESLDLQRKYIAANLKLIRRF